MVKVAQKLIKTNRTPSAVDIDVHRGFDKNLDPFVFAGVTQSAEEVWI